MLKAQIAMPDTVCIGATRTYQVNNASAPSTYSWYINGGLQTTNNNTITVTWNNAGTFLLSVQEHGAGGCDGDIRSGTVIVKPLPVANAGPDVTTCLSGSLQLNGSGGGVYQWSPSTYLSNIAISNPVFTPPSPGVYTYVLQVSDPFGCKASQQDTIVFTILPAAKVFAGNDTFVAVNQQVQLKAIDVNGVGLNQYRWSPSSGLNNAFISNPVATAFNKITYTVTASNAFGCVAKDDITLTVFAAADIFVPNAFTPNGDGVNDILRPILVGIKELKYFAVYNRYGQQVYYTTEPGKGWDGSVNGVMQNTSSYVWTVEAEDINGGMIKKNGMATLIK
ncbi:MAG: gliding motility-associated C-terminal domain-containing protein [Bacteroidetes bacterium]|nr:gliding motility-associated C-terminal domain-containing protein [Bacteroidota bacterium]